MASLTDYVTLGRCGLRVSPFCLGTMTFGEEWGWGSDVETSKRVIDTYVDRGGNFLDTANIYTKGHSEKIIGDHVGADPAKRDRLVIATKCTGNLKPGDPNGGGAGRKSLMSAVDESLRRLRTDYIDLLWSHFYDFNTPIEEMLRTFDDLVRCGKVRYVGLSDHPAWVCTQSHCLCSQHDWAPISAIQIEYSLVERSVEGELMTMARHFGMGVCPWSPLKGGILTGKYTRDSRPDEGRGQSAWTKNIDDRMYTIIDALIDISKQVGCTPAQAALKWVQDQPGVTSTIIGARTLDQLEANLGALDVDLSPEHLEKLDEVSAIKQPFPYDFVRNVQMVIQGGASVNGARFDLWDMAPQSDAERY